MVKKVLLAAILIEATALFYMIHTRSDGHVLNHSQKQVELETLALPVNSIESKPAVAHTSTNVDNIKEKYRNKMEQLEAETELQLYSIFESNIEQLKQKWSFTYFADFKNQIEQLEADTDIKFNEIYSKLEKELEENGYSKTKAEELKKEYEQKKEAYTKSILNIVVQKLGI